MDIKANVILLEAIYSVLENMIKPGVFCDLDRALLAEAADKVLLVIKDYKDHE